MGLGLQFPSWETGQREIDEAGLEEEDGDENDNDGGGKIVSYGGGRGKNGSVGGRHTKLCARGHWRPAEDAKLKELVAHYGPQNWNLIAENLRGRSGNGCLVMI